ncbi:MAG: methyltransferase domain-containing protein [Holophaga sp.]
MTSWDPGQYLKFADERTRPSRDLCARIPLPSPGRVLDLGCGPGNSTQVLRERWPEAEIAGLDSSPEMIAKARALFPGGTWIVADAAAYQPLGELDVVFSNAVLHWVPDHPRFLPRLLGWLAPGGCLAVQMPAGDGNRLRGVLNQVARRPRWQQALAGAGEALTFHPAPFYYDLLAPLTARLDLWETVYYHPMASHQALLEWYEGTGMRPYLERLPDEAARAAFRSELLEAFRSEFPLAVDGKVAMPFRRLFFVAWKAGNGLQG